MTDGPAINHPSYFLQSSFIPGGRSLFFTSYRTGAPQLFEISLETGVTRQLTSGIPIHSFSAALHPDRRNLVVTRGGGLWAIDRETLAERRIAELPGAELGECSISADGGWLTAAHGRSRRCDRKSLGGSRRAQDAACLRALGFPGAKL